MSDWLSPNPPDIADPLVTIKMENLKPNSTEIEFLNLAYNRFYDLYEEVMSDDYWNKDEWERFS